MSADYTTDPDELEAAATTARGVAARLTTAAGQSLGCADAGRSTHELAAVVAELVADARARGAALGAFAEALAAAAATYRSVDAETGGSFPSARGA